MNDQSLIQNVLSQTQAATQNQAQQQSIDLFASYKRNKDEDMQEDVKKKK